MTPGQLRRVEVAGMPICLVKTGDGRFFALSDTCTHENYSLSEGELWGDDLECPMHASRFNLLTGHPDQLPATVPVRTYPVTVTADDVFIET
jgi:3-phenylpropionate/trans-cinnamate dioxygenase ferredoxin component